MCDCLKGWKTYGISMFAVLLVVSEVGNFSQVVMFEMESARLP